MHVDNAQAFIKTVWATGTAAPLSPWCRRDRVLLTGAQTLNHIEIFRLLLRQQLLVPL